ncbi:uncharacterized protein UV8b_06497 [Ustilaginoidea virens]|uniref:Xylanolytic transcriptional activator regulatory domain-containing protein n=2 Tax=Ustilaginoidea virens TaxID=1159556 RepID=A0A8E5HVF9_USTVR|nr:uncharacterized protein UV8b_06497 [Ustilaginoidea virens]QUC22256.1 hypothetical protein UV8b_06497 [Ustilaginoidea virens]
MYRDYYRLDSHQTRQVVDQERIGPAASQDVYLQPTPVALSRSPTAIMNADSFPDFSFPSACIEQNHMMSLPEIILDSPIAADFSRQADGLTDNGAYASHYLASMSAESGPFFLDQQAHRGSSLDVLENHNCGNHSPAENGLQECGTDELDLPISSRADGTDLGLKTSEDRVGAPPAWSELKTKAGKDLTARKTAPRTDYMTMLDKRLKRMEDRLIKVTPKSDLDTTAPVTRALVKPAILGGNTGNKPASKKRGAEEAFGSDLAAWAKASAEVKVVVGAVEMPFPKHGESLEENLLLQEGAGALPSKETQEHLAEVFFDSVYGQAYHLLHKPSYMRKLRNNSLPPVLILSVCAVASRFALQSSNSSATTKPFLRGEEWASHARDICTRRYEWPNITVLTCLLILGLHEFGTCQGGRSWALGGQAIRMAFALQLHRDLEYDPSRQGSKEPLSFIDRETRRRIMWACFLMDRFNSSGSDRPMFIKEESLQIQLPVKESYFQLDIPAKTELLDGSLPQSEATDESGVFSEREEHMDVAAYTIRAVAIWGRIVAYFYHGGRERDAYPSYDEKSTFMALVQQAEQLHHSLPDSLQYSSDNLHLHSTEKTASQFLLMHLSLQQNILFLHKAAVSPTSGSGDQDPPSDFLPQMRAKTLMAANRISEILRDGEKCSCTVTAPFAGYCAFFATSVHILEIFSGNSNTKTTAEMNAGINITYLRKAIRYWGMFHWMVENIRTQYRTALEASRSGNLCLQGLWAWPLLQHADWFNRYSHGVSDSDVAEPAAAWSREKGEDAVLGQRPELQPVQDFFASLASPSGTEGRAASQGSASKRKRSGDAVCSPKASNRTGEAVMNHVDAALPRILSQQGAAAASQHASVSPGDQTTAGTGPAVFSPAALAHVQTQLFCAMSPLSPGQAGTFHQHDLDQAGFYSVPHMPQVSCDGSNHAANAPQNIEQQQSFGAYVSTANGHPIMGSITSSWQTKDTANNKILDADQGAINMREAHFRGGSPMHQGQSGADVLDGYPGSNLPPGGWFMPLSMEPPQSQNVIFSGGAEPCRTVGNANAMDPFNTVLGSNGSVPHQIMDGLRHSL